MSRHKGTPTEQAKRIVWGQIEAYLEAGQPMAECMENGGPCETRHPKVCKTCTGIVKALKKIQKRCEVVEPSERGDS